MKFKQVKFTQAFLNVIYDLLSDVYSIEDYLNFFYFFDHYMAYSEDDWVQFDMHTVRGIFGRYQQNWKLPMLIKILTDRKILESKPYYFNLKDKSKSTTRRYRYTEGFLKKIITEDINFSTGNITFKAYENLAKENVPLEPHLLAQYKILKSERFQIDVENAALWLVESLKNRTISKNSFQVNMRVVLSLDNKDGIYVKQDDKTGRVFTNFTCMKKELRQFCTIDNSPLQSLDLKSAQPTFLAHHLLELYPLNNDVKRFFEVITQSDIYNHLDKYMFHKETYVEFMPDELRDNSKIEFMRWLFSDTRGMTEYDKAIQKEFPDVWKFVQEKKKIYKKQGSNYAVELQKIEAKVFIEGTSESISEGILTVHDSVYFKQGLEGRVEGLLSNALKKNKINFYKLVQV